MERKQQLFLNEKLVRLKKVGKIHYRSQLMNVSEVPVDYKVNKTKLDI